MAFRPFCLLSVPFKEFLSFFRGARRLKHHQVITHRNVPTSGETGQVLQAQLTTIARHHIPARHKSLQYPERQLWVNHDRVEPAIGPAVSAFLRWRSIFAPTPNITRITQDDVLAIRAWLGTFAPVRNKQPPPQLRWPHRLVMRRWNFLFFAPGTFKPDPRPSKAWNSGAYLVEGAAHCGACHTPKNAFGADRWNRHLGAA
jgi:hypothetical protein